MPRLRRVPVSITLEYTSTGKDEPPRVYRNFPVPPANTNELLLMMRPFDHRVEEHLYDAGRHGRPYVTIEGTPRALEELGRYLIALARLETANERPDVHLDDVASADGGTAHLRIVRRST